MFSLKIQNCVNLKIITICDTIILYKSMSSCPFQFSHLHIVNISHMDVKNMMKSFTHDNFGRHRLWDYEEELWDSESDELNDKNGENKYFYYHIKRFSADTLKNIVFENIKYANFGNGFFPSGLGCNNIENERLESFKIVNVSENHFNDFSKRFPMLKEILIDNVTLIPSNQNAQMYINNAKAIVKIKNSDLTNMKSFLKGRISKVKYF